MHGVPEEVIRDVKRDVAEFFKLPLEAKKACAQLPDDIQGFVFSETQKFLILLIRYSLCPKI